MREALAITRFIATGAKGRPAYGRRLLFAVAALPLAAWPASAQTAPSVPDRALLNPLSETGLSDDAAFFRRPLFAPSRRRPEAPPVARLDNTVALPRPQLNLRLLGTIRSGPMVLASVQNLDTDTMQSLKVGDKIGGWTLASVGPSSVRFAMGDEDREFELFNGAIEPLPRSTAVASGSPGGASPRGAGPSAGPTIGAAPIGASASAPSGGFGSPAASSSSGPSPATEAGAGYGDEALERLGSGDGGLPAAILEAGQGEVRMPSTPTQAEALEGFFGPRP